MWLPSPSLQGKQKKILNGSFEYASFLYFKIKKFIKILLYCLEIRFWLGGWFMIELLRMKISKTEAWFLFLLVLFFLLFAGRKPCVSFSILYMLPVFEIGYTKCLRLTFLWFLLSFPKNSSLEIITSV